MPIKIRKFTKTAGRIVTLAMIFIMVVSILSMTIFEIDAATIEDSNVFLKQQTDYTCTLVSATMMVRRTAILLGLDNWESITESSMRKVAWKESAGLYYNFSYNLNGTKITVRGYENGLSGSYETKKAKLISLLEDHPEGVVVYNHWPAHAVLLTKYDKSTDTFYCADPLPSISKGQIPLAKSSLSGSGQENKISGLDTYWIVTSPSVSHNFLTIHYDANGGTIADSVVTGTNYKVYTTDGSYAIVRSGPGTNYGEVTRFASGTIVTVTEIQKKSDYTWGRIDYKGEAGWVALGDWMVNMGTAYDNQYYLSSSVVYDRYTSEPVYQKWTYGQQYSDGLHNATTFGLYRDGYTFLGWSLSPGGGTVIDQDAAITPESIVPEIADGSETVTVYAVWKEDICTHNYVYKHEPMESMADVNTHHWRECTKCGDVKNYSIHNWEITPATQTSHFYHCALCEIYTLVNHRYDNECDEYCNDCNHQRTVKHSYQMQYNETQHWQECTKCGGVIEQKEHNYNPSIVNGYEKFTCKTCKYTYQISVSDTTETETEACTQHVFGAWTIVTQATCEQEGEQQQACTICGEVNTQSIAVKSHEMGAWYDDIDPRGVLIERRDCKNCSKYETRSRTAAPTTPQTPGTYPEKSTIPVQEEGCIGAVQYSVLPVLALLLLAGAFIIKKKHW